MRGRPSRVAACVAACVAAGVAVALGGALVPIMALPTRAAAQDSVIGDTAAAPGADRVAAADTLAPWSVSGRVVRPEGERLRPVPELWVVLHRVGSDTAGPLDSMRTRGDGRFHFTYRRRGSGDAVYFLSASYGGIAYFSSVLRARHASGDDAEIEVFDTTSGPLALHVQGHHVVVSAPRQDGTRELVEVYDLSNDSSVTLISPDDAHPTFTSVLPAGATHFQVGQTDVSPNAIRADSGRVEVVAPFAPGLKQLSFAYRVPPSSFPLAIPIERPTTILEVLLEEPAAGVTGAKISAVQPVSVEGRGFHRFLGHDVPANEVLTITVPTAGGTSKRALYLAGIAIAVGAAMLIALATAFTRRARPVVPLALGEVPIAMTADGPEAIARTIAALDADFERSGTHDAREHAAYRAQRDVLKRRLAVALDAQRRQG